MQSFVVWDQGSTVQNASNATTKYLMKPRRKFPIKIAVYFDK